MTSVIIKGVPDESSTIPGVIGRYWGYYIEFEVPSAKGNTDEPRVIRIESQGWRGRYSRRYHKRS